MSIKHSLIGRGGFGFVVSPNLFVADDPNAKINFNSVSKIFIEKNDAENEIYNHKIVDKIDPIYYYHLRILPISPEDNKIIGTISKIDLKKLNLPNNITKLIKSSNFYVNYDFGGLNLVDLFEQCNRKYYNKTIYVRICNELLKIIYFIKKLIENELIHHDLKPNNIVVDNNLTLKVIDFGLLESIPDYHVYCSDETNKNPMGLYEFFPFENEYYNINNFRNCLEISAKNNYLSKLEYLKNRFPYFFKKYGDNHPTGSATLFYQQKYNEMIDTFYYSVTAEPNEKRTKTHDEFLKTSFLTFDIYTFGMTLIFITEQYVENILKKRTYDHCYYDCDYEYKYPEWIEFDTLYELICKMITPNVFERIQIDELIIEFEKYIALFSHC